MEEVTEDKGERIVTYKVKDEMWGIRMTKRDDGFYEQEILLPSGRVEKTGVVASVVKSTDMSGTEALVSILGTRIKK